MLLLVTLSYLFEFLPVALSSALEKRANTTTGCITNSCLRAVSQVGFSATPDCSSYELAIATPTTTSTYTVITVTITGIETIWLPTIDYLVWEPTQTSAAQFFLPNTTIVSNHTTIANKRHVLPRATILALPPYATACSSSAAYLSACSCIGVHATRSPVVTTFTTTVTETIPTATVTSIATFTREVCGPYNNYGFIYDSVDVYFNNPNITACSGPIEQIYPGLCSPLALFREPTLNHHDCCAACYTSINGCYSYSMDLSDPSVGGICAWTILDTAVDLYLNAGGNATLYPGSGHCPNGNTYVVETTPGNSKGVGPCAHGWLNTAY